MLSRGLNGIQGAEGRVPIFTVGAKVQTKDEFDMRVKARFGKSFHTAWREALAYVKGFDKSVLLSTDEFFNAVYMPVRDEWAEHWSAAADQA